jgi:hypothetical protein
LKSALGRFLLFYNIVLTFGTRILQTLAQLKAGELAGIKHLALAENLDVFPLEILSLADSLEVLDLSNNQLSNLPADLACLHKLKIIFASNNRFESLPEVLGQCLNLEMVGFKSNQIKQVSAAALPQKLRWLILTDNLIETLPNALGERPRLQKLALAGNRLRQLPQSLGQLHNLELIRISANCLTRCPEQILSLPKLAWIAFSGNPFSRSLDNQTQVPVIRPQSYVLGATLGKGASGVIYQASWQNQQTQFPDEIAVKVFKGQVTSDGYPQDELSACLQVGYHPSIVKPVAQVQQADALALVMELIPPHFGNLGLPPSLQTCTRDTFVEGQTLSISHIDKIVIQMQNVFEHMHSKLVCHGDLYAHNTLIDDEANIIFGDFGAASQYHMLTNAQQKKIKTIERRALCYFIEDLLSICDEQDRLDPSYQRLKQLIGV